MFKDLLIVFMLAFAGCAATANQQEMSITCPDGEFFYKKDYAPLDFPDEIFVKYSCKRSKVYPYDLDSDGKNDIVWSVYYDKDGKEEAWWVLRISENDTSKATTWAFLKNIGGVATITWENKKLKKRQREWLDGVIKLINEEITAKEK